MPSFRPERRAFLLGALASGAISLASGTLKAKLPGSAAVANQLTIAVGSKAVRLFELLGELYAAHSSMEITVLNAGDSATSQLEFMQEHGRRKTGEKGAVDVFGADIVHMTALADRHLIRKVADIEIIDFLSVPAGTCHVSPSQNEIGYYGLPFSSNVGMLFARSGASITRTAPDLPDLLRQHDAPGYTWTAQMSAQPSDHGEGLLCNFFEHAVAVTGCESLISTAGRPSRDLQMWGTALAAIRSARDAKLLQPCKDDTEALKLYNLGQIDYMRNWPTFLHRSIGEDRVMPTDLIPMGTGILGGINLAITANTTRDHDAREFVAFLTGAEAQKVVALYGLPPTRKEIYDNSDLIPIVPHLSDLKQSIKTARQRPASSDYGAFSNTMVSVIRRCLGSNSAEITEADIERWEKYL